MSEHELWNELGNLYFLSGAYGQAANAYQRSIQLDTGFGRPYSNLALTYVQQGKYEEAIDLYRRSIELLTENKEKATSWNRLGAVYRHLKNYSKAVIAFQEADELDPQSAEEFPVAAGPRAEPVQAPASVLEEASVSPAVMHQDEVQVEDAHPEGDDVEAVLAEDVREQGEHAEVVLAEEAHLEELQAEAETQEETKPEVEWWDVDESRVASATGIETAADSLEDPNASWTPADTTQFQQDLSQMPETGSLTTSGEGEFEDEFEAWPPLDPTPDFDLPDPEDDDLSTWLPLPEEQDMNLDEILVPPFFDELEPEPLPSPEWQEPLPFHTIDAGETVPSISTSLSTAVITELVERNEPMHIQDNQNGAQLAWEAHEVDVDVQERPVVEQHIQAEPAPVFPLPPQIELIPLPDPDPLPVPLIEQYVQPEVAPIMPPEPQAELHPSPEPEPIVTPDASTPERDEDETREVEMGIAKYRRVVQLNPRNSHAWDALGTLYKSAGLYRDAILAYQQAISLDPTRSLYFHHLGLVYACEGRDEDAMTAFQRVLEIDPEYSLAHATLGGYYRKMGLEELAQKHIGKAMKNIFDSENEYNRACLEAICGHADQAIALLGVALKNKQTYVDWILRDPDLDFIRQDPRFKQLISEYTR